MPIAFNHDKTQVTITSTANGMVLFTAPVHSLEKPMAHGKTLRKLLKEELGTDDDDKVDAIGDIVLEWMERVERNGSVALASHWRSAIEQSRSAENESGIGR